VWGLKIYVETSVWNAAIATPDDYRRGATDIFLERAKEEELHVSELVVGEIELTKDRKRRESLREVLLSHEPTILSLSEECNDLASQIVRFGAIPRKFLNDALHIAAAVIGDMDILVSWNMRHIVKLKTKRATRSVCALLGYKAVEILTPQEVF
jgi:predicted nucleic acid-binding protein